MDRVTSSNIRIAIVDDHSMFVQAITQLLDREPDIEITGGANTVADGLRLVAETQPDVAIVDFQLPDGDGASLTAAIGKASPATRVMILSGSDAEQHVVAAVDAGCAGFVSKARAADDLGAAVRTVHSGETYIEPKLLAHLLPRARRSYHRVGDDLTKRELEILRLLADGLTNEAIAANLVVSVHTVRNHVQNVLRKLDAHSKLEAVAIATREDLLH
ncbi:MAG TPA: response regulator transcription factor [Acidimicrobiia bacterium]